MDLSAETSYFSTRIRRQFADDLKRLASIPPEAIEEVLATDPFGLEADQLAVIRRQLEFTFSVRQDAGHSIKSDYKPWLKDRMPDLELYFWTRLRQYYVGDDILPPNVVSQLDHVTDEVLDYCGNPFDEGAWARRGMVMGHVQSGKTTNYASLICKAADAGYKIVILLAGLTNSLRKQTQERLDETFIGKKALFGQTHPELMPIMTYCGTERIFPAFGTTRDADFNNRMATQFGVSLANLRHPIIFVIKKNKSVLENLLGWIEPQAAAAGEQIHYPLMMIDDEADNASVNTHNDPQQTTAINHVIRRILKQFSRSTYVGYTATPFANIFIDPDSEDEMRGDDLFPRHFIKALDPPTNYVGAERVFAPDGDLRNGMVRVVQDYEDILPLSHKKNVELDELPTSLLEAIRVFVLVRAIRILRGDGARHCSMMINVSRFNDVQDKVHGLTYAYQKQLDDAIKVNAGLGAAAVADPDMAALKDTFDKEFSDTEFDFAHLLEVLAEASRSITVRTVNMRGGLLDYEANKERGLHVLAIGGLALSRGLTLEGLAVSYILRNSAASDTLMQMARWFGYRRNYEEICRLYIAPSSVDHYEYICEAVEELRGELKRMEVRNETPEQFGLKVRRSETGILITASNKMRNAQRMELVQSFESRHVEGYALHNDLNINRTNLDAISDFVRKLSSPAQVQSSGDPAVQREIGKHLVWKNADGRDVQQLLQAFDFPAAQPSLARIDGRSSLFGDYVAERISDELARWDVAIPLNFGNRPATVDAETLLNYRDLPLRARNQGGVRRTPGGSVFKPMGDRNRICDPNEDPPMLLTADQREQARALKASGEFKGDRAFCSVRERPLLLIHLFQVAAPIEGLEILNSPVASLSFMMPGTAREVAPRSYEVNAVFRRQLELFASEPEDDEELVDA